MNKMKWKFKSPNKRKLKAKKKKNKLHKSKGLKFKKILNEQGITLIQYNEEGF